MERISSAQDLHVNGELKSEFYDIRNEDSIRIENFYTVEQLFTFLDLDYKDYDVLVNNMPANKHTKVYEILWFHSAMCLSRQAMLI